MYPSPPPIRCHSNRRISFNVYFLDTPTSVTSHSQAEIVEVLAQRSQPVAGQEGSEVRRIDDVTLDFRSVVLG